MKEGSQALIEKAARSIRAAQTLLDHGDADFAASRAYYAMFYAAEALLLEKGLRAKKHSGVHAVFGEQFAKTGQLDPKLHRWLLDAFDKRLEGDYESPGAVSPEDAATIIEQAREFLSAAERFLASTPPPLL
jgi:uncharacterized protein (UPF0332 family)